jgi:hypothetical protein
MPLHLFGAPTEGTTAAVASVLTARTWRDRKLGDRKMFALPKTADWLASGNNTWLPREMIPRTAFCRPDARHDPPWERPGFRPPNLLRWVKENGGPLVWAALTLARAWVAAGKLAGTQVPGEFEAWVEVIVSALGVAGVPGRWPTPTSSVLAFNLRSRKLPNPSLARHTAIRRLVMPG